MKLPIKLIEDYQGNKSGDILLVNGHDAHDLLIERGIATELTDDELDNYMLGIDETEYEELFLEEVEEEYFYE